tara:strand:+ start:1185 stop:1628 length:444 start_codon:yes stop_codon:yes gene_type:complete
MIKRIFFFTLLFISLFYSCVAKKTTTEYKEIIKRDSVYIIKNRFITQKVVDTLIVKQPCDVITGKLKEFEKEIRTNNAKVTLKSVKGNIQVSVNIDSIVSSKIQEFKLNYKTEKEIKEVEKIIYRTPLWVWLVILIESLIIFILVKY